MKYFFVLLVFILTFTSCNKKNDNFTVKKTNLNEILDLSYFPAKTTALAIIDFKSIYTVKAFTPLFKDLFKKIKKDSNVDFSELNYISAYINIKDLKNNPFLNSAVILDGVRINNIKNMPPAVKTEKYEGVKINIYDDNTGYAVIKNKTVGGSIEAVKNAVLLNKGKAKNLASTPQNTLFKNIIKMLNGSQINFVFVSNDKISEEIAKYTSGPEFLIIKPFLKNFKAAGFGLKADDKDIKFKFVLKSSKDSVKSLVDLVNSQMKNIKENLEKQTLKLQAVITPQGVEILNNFFSTLKVKAEDEYLITDLKMSLKDAAKIPEIMMIIGMMPSKMKK